MPARLRLAILVGFTVVALLVSIQRLNASRTGDPCPNEWCQWGTQTCTYLKNWECTKVGGWCDSVSYCDDT